MAKVVRMLGLAILIVGGFGVAARADACDSSSQACVPGQRIESDPILLRTSEVVVGGDANCDPGADGWGCSGPGTGPIAILGNATCDARIGCGSAGTGPMAVGGDARCHVDYGCGERRPVYCIGLPVNACVDLVGIGPVAIGGDSDCRTGGGCGYDGGSGAIAVGGDARCEADYGCGLLLGIGALAVGGDASCRARSGCGSGFGGTGPIAIGGDASCEAAQGCGDSFGTGPIATGDVSCHGTCGREDSWMGIPLLRSGTPGIALAGHASCDRPFDVARASDLAHLKAFQCIGIVETAHGLIP